VDAHLWLAQSENIAQRLPDGRQDAAVLEGAAACARPESPAEIIELPEQTAQTMLWPGQTHRRPQ